MKTIFLKPATVERKWYLIDAEGVALGRVAVEAANILRGKKKACYTPHQEVGDYVVIINAAKAKMTGNKAEGKMYYRHSGYLGGLKSENYKKLVSRKPTAPMEKAIKGMLPKGPLGYKLFTNVKVYGDANHLHEAQQPQIVEVK
ncbi:MAG: 50S ribosomal protein L13 [Spirochaetaceae bacterium]|jgi:large subunit ribosomal protein L13|nr:50S ribosomal protein L13 [Spirochaetaceae bacterium]